jgi:NO-binding membrane sensor protein with MHYT domain
MHFVGMLAFVMPMPVSYDLGLTVLSLVVAVVVVGIGLALPGRLEPRGAAFPVAGMIVGLGIASMHYIGMKAMQMPGAAVDYRQDLVTASLVIAVVAASVAIWLAFRTKRSWERLLASLLMGAAIAGMHYTGMAAAAFRMVDHTLHEEGVPSTALTFAVAGSTCFLLLLGLVTAFFDRKLATLTASEAAALQESEERQSALIRNSAGIVLIVTPDGMVTYEGSSALPILRIRSKDIVGRHLSALVGHANIAAVLQLLGSIVGASGGRPRRTSKDEGTLLGREAIFKDAIFIPT